MKKKLLIAYPHMMMGGSTTSLLAFLRYIDKEQYEVYLQLYRHEGELLEYIPQGIRVLPAAALHDTLPGRIIKAVKFFFGGYMLRAYREGRKAGKKKPAAQVLIECQACAFSRRLKTRYDYAIGYMEGWADKYVAHCVNADVKYGWIHSTFENIAPLAHLEFPWMRRMDKVVFVTEPCREDFCAAHPAFAEKTAAVANIIDSAFIRRRSEEIDPNDAAYHAFAATDAFKLVTVCRTDIRIKGLDRILACAKRFHEQGLAFQWCLVGDGKQLDTLREQIVRLGLDECVHAVGLRLNPYPFIKAADVYCMPSRYEGKPMVVTESMILGTPPVVTAYLSAHEQIQNGIEGIVVENADDTIYDALLPFLKDPDALRPFNEYLLAHNYGNDAYMREIERQYLF